MCLRRTEAFVGQGGGGSGRCNMGALAVVVYINAMKGVQSAAMLNVLLTKQIKNWPFQQYGVNNGAAFPNRCHLNRLKG